jgi:dihydrolipoamide dehydrogenase
MLDWPTARDYRDYMARHLDDSRQVTGYADQGAVVLKGEARITGIRRVQVGEREVTADHLVIATGSSTTIPPIPGLDEVTTWTNRETYTLADLPARAVIIGGGPVGIETAQFLARFGVAVTLLERSDRVLDREEPRVSELAAGYLREAGVEVRTGASVRHAHREGAESVVDFDDGSQAHGTVVILATGRAPRTAGLGLEHTGVGVGERGEIIVDEHCRVPRGCGRSGTSPASCRSPMSPSTKAASSPTASWVARGQLDTRASLASCSPTRKSPPPGSPRPRPTGRA